MGNAYKINNGDEWDMVSDIGGDMATAEFEEEEYALHIINSARNRRLNALIGKYVIVCDSANDKGLLFLQDQSICRTFRGHYWTTYMSNARGFVDWSQAKIKCGNLMYNNPRVRYVDRNHSLRIPREEVK